MAVYDCYSDFIGLLHTPCGLVEQHTILFVKFLGEVRNFIFYKTLKLHFNIIYLVSDIGWLYFNVKPECAYGLFLSGFGCISCEKV